MANKMTFAQWMAQVNVIIQRRTGYTADDLPDYCYLDAWRFGDTPEEAAADALEYAENY